MSSRTILSLPPEILTEIFLNVNSSFPDESDLGLTYYRPVEISQVCPHWRSLALNTPQLWSTLALEWDKDNVCRNETICHKWLGRSGTNALTLSMEDHSRKRGSESTSLSAEILRTILPYKTRWKHLRLQISTNALVSTSVLFTKPEFFPLFESLIIVNGSSFPTIIPDWPTVSADLWPNFKRLSFRNLWTWMDDPGPALTNFPWGRLTHLSFAPIQDCVPLLQLLGRFTRLTFLQITLYHSASAGGPLPLATLPLLQVLVISSPYRDLNWLLEGLLLPSLVIIRLEGQVGSNWNPIQSMITHIQRSGHPAIEQIQIIGAEAVPDDDMVALLALVPQIMTLEVDRTFFGNSLFKALSTLTLARMLNRLVLGILADISMPTIGEFIMLRRDLLDIVLCLSQPSERLQAFLDANGTKYRISDKLTNDESTHVNDVFI